MEWRTPLRTKGERHGSDVTITSTEDAETTRYVVTFRNDTFDLVSPNGKKIAYGVENGNKIGFIEVDKGGWTLSGKEGHSTKKIQLTPVNKKDERQFRSMIGDYDLQYNADKDYYYISMEGKKQ